MTLASDMLARFSAPVKTGPAPRPRKPKPEFKKRRKYKPAPKPATRPATPPGVTYYAERRKAPYRAFINVGKRMHNLGEFGSMERAHLAVKLYRLWQQRGCSDIPCKPSFRLYTRFKV